MNEIKTIHYNLSNFKREVYKCLGGMRLVVIKINESNDFYIKIGGDIVTFFKWNYPDVIVSAKYSNEHGLPESIKFYNQDDDIFYCFENVRRVYEEAAYDEIEDDDDDE
jgi:hypothetical protein